MVALAAPGTFARQEPQRTTFRSSADLVSVAVVVRGNDGRLVTGLKADDFEILDRGQARPIVNFDHGQQADARMALLVDSSGSMVVGPKRDRAKLATDFLIAGFSGGDTASVFSFDSDVRQLTPFTRDGHTLRNAVGGVVPFGTTCLYDAIVGTIRSVKDEAPRTRGLVLLTDGVDTASLHSAQDAAIAAASLDLPVYVLGVDNLPGVEPSGAAPTKAAAGSSVSLGEIARRTGGIAGEASSPAQLSILTRTILAELHSQYLLAFTASPDQGWHPLSVKVRKGRTTARSREGYMVH
jgi:Ca-activated chloride channel homolog